MTRLPILSADAVIGVLHRLGFNTTRTKGSHHILKHPDGRGTVVPVHGNRDISRPLLHKILRQAKVEIGEFVQLSTEG